MKFENYFDFPDLVFAPVFFFFFFSISGPYPQHMEAPGPGVEPKPQL